MVINKEFIRQELILLRINRSRLCQFDDVLASALASFLSSTSIEPQKYALAVKALELLHGEDGSIDKNVLSESHFGVTSEPCSLVTRDSTTASVFSDCPLERIREVTCYSNDNDSDQTAKEVVEDRQGQVTCHDAVDCRVTPVRHGLHHIGDMGNGEVRSGTRKSLVNYIVEVDILNQYLENHVDVVSGIEEEGAPRNAEIKAEVTKVLQKVMELSHDSSVVDFETPILEVKFTSSENNSKNKSPLEALMSDMPITDTVDF
ncbi:hypothetical protein DITRI_Ditri11bG0181000 [Diplodiscus trichospermus]